MQCFLHSHFVLEARFSSSGYGDSLTVPNMTSPTSVLNIASWYVVHQNLADIPFNWLRSWSEYRDGFGQPASNFWIGLEKLHLLTTSDAYRLRVELRQNATGFWYSAEYWSFSIQDEANTRVSRNF
jgi:Fibrinogen beta and gamma chains, C-terminal globular domain